MKAFRFPMQAVIVVRELELKRAEAVYAETVKEVEAKKAAIARGQSDLLQMQQQMVDRRSGSFQAAEQPHLYAAGEAMRAGIEGLHRELLAAEDKKEAALKKMVESKRAHDGVIEIRDKRKQDHLKGELAAEEREIEEMCVARMHSADVKGRK